MADHLSSDARSRLMARVRSRGSIPEITVRRALHAAGYRFRLHRKDLPGKPDIVLARYRTAVFVHGCFWHGHECRKGKRPDSNADFWNRKLDRNQQRDREAQAHLHGQGWSVVIVWECRLAADTAQLIRQLSQSDRAS